MPLPSPVSSPPTRPTFSSLPAEIHSLILPHLPYPDALSLKYTSPYFYTIVDTSIRVKVSWLIDRQARGLPCPQKKCILKTDAAFCQSSGGQVWRLMEKRRRHEECGIDRCEVLVGRKCDVAASKGRTGGLIGGMMHSDQCMHGIDPRLVAMAALIILISFLVNVGLGLGMDLK
ncbi:MAG: hypothetical protein LQ348_002236 [Seirophora lacunosa]|nr:MAG: hypothetical protein LQ348_002236 [Seirophora lacunosa]